MRFNLIPKRVLIFSFFLVLSNIYLDAQDMVYEGKKLSLPYSPRDFILGLAPNYVYREDAFPRITGSLNMQYFIARNVSINGNISLGQDYAHFGPGILGVPWMALGTFQTWFSSDDFLMLFLIMAGSFENTSFHFPVGNNLDLSPYFSLLRFQYLYEPPVSRFNDFSGGLALGSKLNIILSDHWIIAPYIEYTRTYISGHDGIQGGFYAGYYFKSKISIEDE
ncbi:MAG: hypothetical protein AMS27_06405 [Bacteroides sp. SM23_62_1]|nr:MAG: hypothetical protein AMS27_06405 [Bacteroides sp. SM23_62_1]